MRLRVDTTSPTPVYEQIREQLAAMINAGIIAPGTRLPTIRQLALDLGIAKATVNKAYEHLLQNGLVEGHGIRGTIVRHVLPHNSQQRTQRELEQAARAFVTRVSLLGADDATAHRLVDRVYAEMRKQS